MTANQESENVRAETGDRSLTETLKSWVHVEPAEISSGFLVRVEGWVFSDSDEQICQVRAVSLGKTWPATYPISRPDVAAAFPSAASAATSGFAVQVAAECGSSFKLVLEANLPAAGWKVFFRKHVILPRRSITPMRSWLRRRTRPLGELPHPGFLLWLDEPLDWTKLPRRFRFSGWCFSTNGDPISAMRARVGRREYAGSYGIFRADVASRYQERPGTFKSGFEIIAEAPRGRATATLEVRLADGSWCEVFSKRISAPLVNLRPVADPQLWEIGDYATWIKRYDTLRRSDRREIRAHIETFATRPLISIVMPVYNSTAVHLRAAIDSVRAQLYSNWELCIVDDASPAKHVRRILSRLAKLDRRIKVRFRDRNGGIAAASNDALALSSGEFVALVDDDDELAPAALYHVAREINEHPDAQLIYSDEDKLDTTGRRTNVHFKPNWNWPLFLAQNFFSHLGVFKSELIKAAGFRAGFEGSQDYDLVLRCAEKIEPHQIRHIPWVLYHWRMSAKSAALNINAKPQARAGAIKAVQEHLARRQIAAEVMSSGDEDFRRVRYVLPNEKPRVSLVIPTRDLIELLQRCVTSILAKTIYPNFELVLIDNGSKDEAALAFLAEIKNDRRVRVFRRDEEFNYGRLNNFGVRSVASEFVALLNNDLTIISPDWLEEMVSQALQPDVAAVGARLLYPDDHIQHAGVILGGGGVAAHAHKGLPRANHGYFSRAILAQELSAVTAACMLVRRSAYLEVGGFDEEHLKVAFSDVDFCLRLRQRGYRIIYTPYAELYHFESASRGLEDTVMKNQRFEAEIKYMHDAWGDALQNDPAYNPNFSLASAGFTLAFPPRIQVPWRKK
jgi:glycosyltransferase involved in cell wall biosynthesis